MNRIVPVIVGSILTAMAYLMASPWLLVAGISVLLPSLLWLALRKRGLRIAVLLAITLGLGLGGARRLVSEFELESAPGELPPRAALVIYGIGIVPGLVFGILFAKWFDKLVLSSERLAELRNQLKGS